jgi:hypothetical protein
MSEQESNGTCFVIMPFRVRDHDLPTYLNDENHWKEVYDGLIFPAVDAANLKCERDDEDLGSRLIVDEIWGKIERAELVLCDLSGSNPNVLLELGWALRADQRFVLIKDDITGPEFDTRGFFTFDYSHKLQPSTLKAEVCRLTKVIEQTLADSDKRYSMVRKLSLTAAIEAQSGDAHMNLLKEVLETVRRMDKPKPIVVQVPTLKANLFEQQIGLCPNCGMREILPSAEDKLIFECKDCRTPHKIASWRKAWNRATSSSSSSSSSGL